MRFEVGSPEKVSTFGVGRALITKPGDIPVLRYESHFVCGKFLRAYVTDVGPQGIRSRTINKGCETEKKILAACLFLPIGATVEI